jgi:hypothetical protein
MKNKNKWLSVALGLSLPLMTQALDFAENTIFLVANTEAECMAQGGAFTEWYEETYCTKVDQEVKFTDVRGTHPHAEAIAYVQSQGIVNGYSDGTFRPNETINRVELLKILVESQYRQTAECKTTFNYSDTLKEAWYQRYVQVASCLNLVSGYPDGSFQPAKAINISEASKMISNAFQYHNNPETAVWYEQYVNNLAARSALPTTIKSISSELTRGQVAEIIYRLKNTKLTLASHSLSSLEAGITYNTEELAVPEIDFETELDALFKELNSENLLDLE